MTNQPLVSVVVIFWNAERFIQEAIDSVFAQTYKNWELLLVDDGSSDGSTTIARSYVERDPRRVRYLEHVNHENRGKSAARNLGIQQAGGDYIAFLDSDDVWFPNILEEQMAILEAYPEAGMVFGPIQYWYSWKSNPDGTEHDFIEDLGVPPDTLVHPPILLTQFIQNKAAVPSDILVRRELIERVGGFEDEFRFMYEDQVFVAKLCVNAAVFASSCCWYRYRQHADSSCAVGQITGEYFSTRPRFLNWLEQYLTEQQIEDPALWQAVKKELWPYRHPILFRLSTHGKYFRTRWKSFCYG
jgi:glycosyltransferase involved in cell wall biosynthesis